ncbi:uncharacterized protein DS421_18g602950 [Arachis hypogaea]|nr:uncharacterized protein DS421_18g602950 [Arachis hypogaea]
MKKALPLEGLLSGIQQALQDEQLRHKDEYLAKLDETFLAFEFSCIQLRAILAGIKLCKIVAHYIFLLSNSDQDEMLEILVAKIIRSLLMILTVTNLKYYKKRFNNEKVGYAICLR